ncbi:MAG: PKD domain-containing protein [Saprospiraceae bacterium]|nr:PKD domain-containing protein [Saprospiraceae bacterium]MBP7800561.1 PKD domain-containing protein [Saprospiraceae bacterium]MBP7922435.1 PKD domain-containing protein [Saprospiraceae bacterium]MBP8096606.1 PKD domain-containing protein [Saprospiraceae bacterium]MBP8940740.1 PKD domain-containing protein [Saprospiraceae bacterium]
MNQVFKINYLKFFLCCLLILSGQVSEARHIIGSDFYYECRGQGRLANTKNYQFSLTIYRDCSNPSGSGYDPDALFGIYRFNGARYIFVQEFTVNHGSISRVLPENNPCLIIPPNVCVEESSYAFGFDLPVIDETYVIYYMRCCRNNTIVNIVAPNNTGATFFIEISPAAQRVCNNSPKFKSFPPIVICADFPFDFDHSAIDKEGDSLVYEFCTPYAGGGSGAGDPLGGIGCTAVRPSPMSCAPPFSYVSFVSPIYSTNDPMGKGVLSLNSMTGQLKGLPQDLGQYVVGICVKEYRNGALLGSIHRDFQFNIGTCEQAVTAKVMADTSVGKRFTINYCGDRSVQLQNESFRPEYIKTYYWEFKSKNNPNNPLLTSNDRNASILFPEPGEYTGLMIVNKNAAVCSDTALIDLKIIPSDIKADFEFVYDKCSSLPIQFRDKSTGVQTPVKLWSWNFKDGTQSSSKNPAHLFKSPGDYPVQLTVSDGKICKSSISKDITYFPAPELLDILPDKFRACVPATINFTNLSIPIDTSYRVEWDFGDGSRSSGIDASHTYSKPGAYSIGLTVKAPSGCVTKESFPAFIRLQEGPTSDFSYSPEVITTLNASVQFTNLSANAEQFSWNFGDELGSDESSPFHHYRDTGSYVVTLIAKHQNGCVDTSLKKLDILLNISYFLPNAFTPNNDGVNDIYVGTGALAGMQNFSMNIYNRWGEMIYYSEDPGAGWNGKRHNNGPLEPNGVYVCIVKYQTDHGENRTLKSFATLIR